MKENERKMCSTSTTQDDNNQLTDSTCSLFYLISLLLGIMQLLSELTFINIRSSAINSQNSSRARLVSPFIHALSWDLTCTSMGMHPKAPHRRRQNVDAEIWSSFTRPDCSTNVRVAQEGKVVLSLLQQLPVFLEPESPFLSFPSMCSQKQVRDAGGFTGVNPPMLKLEQGLLASYSHPPTFSAYSSCPPFSGDGRPSWVSNHRIVAEEIRLRVTCPNMMEFLESLGADMEISNMSFSKKNVLGPYFWQIIREIMKFKDDVLCYLEELENNPDIDRDETLGQFIKSRGYSELFQKAYLVPICGSIWSCPSEGIMSFSAFSILSFYRNHHLLQLFGRPQWLTVRSRSHSYVNKVIALLESLGCQIKTGCEVCSVLQYDEGRTEVRGDGFQGFYDGCIMAVHAPDALRILGNQSTFEEKRLLGAFQYVYSDIFLHRDKNFMPRNPAAWSAWNFLGGLDGKACLTYWLNVLQNIGDGETGLPFLVTLNPDHTPNNTLLKWSTGHPVPSVAASKASLELDHIQGKRGIWFCEAYQGYGFHEDGLKAGMIAAHGVLGKRCASLCNPRNMVPSLMERGARLFVARFLKQFVCAGCLILLEEVGTTFTFEGTRRYCNLRTVLRIHNPQFYWKVMTHADLGLADSYIDGDFSFADKEEGLLNLIMILIAIRDLDASVSKVNQKRGWWTPLLFTSGIASASYFLRHISRRNSLAQARRNISYHYDLSNELFALFMDESMTYSCPIFKDEDEDLKVAQMRKHSLQIEKARVSKGHGVLEIGCGWGTFAIEVVRQTGCNYTGITLSAEQLKYAEMKVNEAGLQDHIRLYLCDYRQLPKAKKYDRIISCEMMEAVGHDYMEEYFGCCESLLAKDGLLVLQFSSTPDARYNEYRLSSDFIKEYIFPGGCLPSLSRITSAMAAASSLSVEQVENIGMHYYKTLRCWRKNFMENQSKILALGFNEKFIRTWEYYFDYSAAGFKTRTLGNYQSLPLANWLIKLAPDIEFPTTPTLTINL
ncbi:Amino oxidase domain-containing protein [Citrus sinensis]|uniref:Amino oxidase domain-containing protein n=1 Tax=Citrus sinensis TaxID=2711 RepID=A0ACB8I460_CITSI|nr:Amino oxidase domain-containing protein [Citrus sinensis]